MMAYEAIIEIVYLLVFLLIRGMNYINLFSYQGAKNKTFL